MREIGPSPRPPAAAILSLGVGWGLVVSLGRVVREGIALQVVLSTTRITAMVFVIVIGAQLFSLVFRGLGGDEMVHAVLSDLPGGTIGAVVVVMAVMFVLIQLVVLGLLAAFPAFATWLPRLAFG